MGYYNKDSMAYHNLIYQQQNERSAFNDYAVSESLEKNSSESDSENEIVDCGNQSQKK